MTDPHLNRLFPVIDDMNLEQPLASDLHTYRLFLSVGVSLRNARHFYGLTLIFPVGRIGWCSSNAPVLYSGVPRSILVT